MTGRAIDILCQLFTEENVKGNLLQPGELAVLESVGRGDGLRGYTPKEFLEKLSAVGVEKVLIPSILVWHWREQRPQEITPVNQVIKAAEEFPDRIFGLYGVNPRSGMDGVAELEEAVKEHGFKGIHIHPHGFGFPPNHAYYFPFYAKCQELEVPAVLSMGHSLEPVPMEFGRPIHLDEVALYFPKLKIVCAHTGWPWVEEAIALAARHPNVFIGTSAYAPKYWKPEMVRFLDSRRGHDKVMWGTDWPLIKHEESLQQIDDLGLKEESKERLLYANAARVFDLG